jgi:hypothetical protein
VHYADSFDAKAKFKDRPELLLPCGAGTARQMIRGDKILVDHDRIGWEYSTKMLRVPPNLSDEVIAAIIRIYIDGCDDGEFKGQSELRAELRHLLGAARDD